MQLRVLVCGCDAVACRLTCRRFDYVFCNLFSALACYNLSWIYVVNGDVSRALDVAREALRIWRLSLPPEHEYISRAQGLIRRLEEAVR